jgi:hypothetical protein
MRAGVRNADPVDGAERSVAADVPFDVMVSFFGALERHHRPDRLLSPLFIQMTCRFLCVFRFPLCRQML